MSHQFKPSEMRRFYRSINDVFTSFESLETIDAGFALTFPATDRWRRTLEGFPREFVERFPAYEASVDGLPDGRLRLHLRGGSESLKFLERVMQGAQAGALELPSRLVSAFRRATVPLRLSPEVLVIGAPRSGTTTLFSLLCDHPRMLGPATKELGFFDISYGRGLSHYRSLFPFRFKRARDGSRNAACTGEAPPDDPAATTPSAAGGADRRRPRGACRRRADRRRRPAHRHPAGHQRHPQRDALVRGESGCAVDRPCRRQHPGHPRPVPSGFVRGLFPRPGDLRALEGPGEPDHHLDARPVQLHPPLLSVAGAAARPRLWRAGRHG